MTEEGTVAEEVIEELEKIAKNDVDGLIQPEAVIDAAYDEASPLHKHFEWDDSEAGHAWRLHQARMLVAKVRIVKIDQGPRYVNVVIQRAEGGQRRGYIQTERAVADPDLYEQVVREAAKGMRAYQIRLNAFDKARDAARDLGKAIEKLKKTVKDKED